MPFEHKMQENFFWEKEKKSFEKPVVTRVLKRMKGKHRGQIEWLHENDILGPCNVPWQIVHMMLLSDSIFLKISFKQDPKKVYL